MKIRWCQNRTIFTPSNHIVIHFFETTKSIFLKMYYPFTENRAGPSNFGNVISQILLCKQINPDFHQEELCSISKDSQEISKLLSEMQEFMPKQEKHLGKSFLFLLNYE